MFDGSQMNKVNLPVACCKGASFKGCSLREATCAGTDLEVQSIPNCLLDKKDIVLSNL